MVLISFISIPKSHKKKYHNIYISLDDYEKNFEKGLYIRKNKGSRTYYAMKWVGDYKSGKKEYLHRFLMGLKKGDELHINHINENGLDNRRGNLQPCSQAENNRNIRKWITDKTTSKYKGVSANPKGKRGFPWRARICIDGKMIEIGQYRTEEEAYNSYCEKAKELHGDFANIINSDENVKFTPPTLSIYEREQGRGKGVLQFTTNMIFLKRWQNATEASKKLGISNVDISKVCLGKRNCITAGGFKWRFLWNITQ